ncbi:MAG: SdrD B-like domain-containing protein, partial [Candidatus Promineifilaceae bacterium]
FGYQPTGATLGNIGDTVWFDIDADGSGPNQAAADGSGAVNQGNGAQDDDREYGIAGVSVALIRDSNGNGVRDANEPIIATDTTDNEGAYLFQDLPITDGVGTDDYLVWVNDSDNVVLSGLEATYDADGAAAGVGISAETNLSTDNMGHDFGYTPFGHTSNLGAIGNTIWFDIDGSSGSTQDPNEPGIEGVIVLLIDNGGNVITTTTDENGHYYFGSVDPDPSYTYIVVVPPENFAAGGVLEGMAQSHDPSGLVDNQSFVTLLPSAPINLNQDFSYAVSGTSGALGNRVWLDRNGDGGVSGSDEVPIGDVTLDLYRDLDCDGVRDAGDPRFGRTSTTSAVNLGAFGTNGNYDFDGLPVVGAGTNGGACFIVAVSDVDRLLNGYWHSSGTAATDNHSQFAPYGGVGGLELTAAAATDLTADFGYFVDAATVGNRVWFDRNYDGVQDSNELGINNITVTLAITYPNGTTTMFATRTGDDPSTTAVERGWYSFGNLLLDEDYHSSTGNMSATTNPAYVLSMVLPNGLAETLTDVASAGELADSDAHTGVAALATRGDSTVTQAPVPTTEVNTEATYDFGVVRVELGDLPDTYNTFVNNFGARHIVFPDDDADNIPDDDGAIWSGATVDTEWEGQSGGQEGQTEGDDNDGHDDEDGLILPLQGELIEGNLVTFSVILRSRGVQTADYGLWIDWNGDGDFDDANEFHSHNDISINQHVTGDMYQISFGIDVVVPSGTVTYPNWIYVRGRSFAANSSFVGGATRDVGMGGHGGTVSNGEVEDFATRLLSPTAVQLSAADAETSPNVTIMALILGVMLLSGLLTFGRNAHNRLAKIVYKQVKMMCSHRLTRRGLLQITGIVLSCTCAWYRFTRGEQSVEQAGTPLAQPYQPHQRG